MKKFAIAVIAGLVLTGCSAPVTLRDTSASHEVISRKANQGPAYVVINNDLRNFRKEVTPGAQCGAWSFPVELGPTLRSSILKTVEGAYSPVTLLESGSQARGDGPIFLFRMEDYNTRLRFVRGFVMTAEASTELSMTVSARNPQGREYYATTIRGTGMTDEQGPCPIGAEAVGGSTQKALRAALENFVTKVINVDHMDK